MQAVYCQHCQIKQPAHWKAGDLCFDCGEAVRLEVRCACCTQWTAPGNFCRKCGFPQIEQDKYGAARMLLAAGIDQIKLKDRLNELDASKLDHYHRQYQKHEKVMRDRVAELELCEPYLVKDQYSRELEEELTSKMPFSSELLAQLSVGPEVLKANGNAPLHDIAKNSPIPSTRFFATLGLLKAPELSLGAREAQLLLTDVINTALTSEDQNLVIEAIAALGHWNMGTNTIGLAVIGDEHQQIKLLDKIFPLLGTAPDSDNCPAFIQSWLAITAAKTATYQNGMLIKEAYERVTHLIQAGLEQYSDSDFIISSAVLLNDHGYLYNSLIDQGAAKAPYDNPKVNAAKNDFLVDKLTQARSPLLVNLLRKNSEWRNPVLNIVKAYSRTSFPAELRTAFIEIIQSGDTTVFNALVTDPTLDDDEFRALLQLKNIKEDVTLLVAASQYLSSERVNLLLSHIASLPFKQKWIESIQVIIKRAREIPTSLCTPLLNYFITGIVQGTEDDSAITLFSSIIQLGGVAVFDLLSRLYPMASDTAKPVESNHVYSFLEKTNALGAYYKTPSNNGHSSSPKNDLLPLFGGLGNSLRVATSIYSESVGDRLLFGSQLKDELLDVLRYNQLTDEIAENTDLISVFLTQMIVAGEFQSISQLINPQSITAYFCEYLAEYLKDNLTSLDDDIIRTLTSISLKIIEFKNNTSLVWISELLKLSVQYPFKANENAVFFGFLPFNVRWLFENNKDIYSYELSDGSSKSIDYTGLLELTALTDQDILACCVSTLDHPNPDDIPDFQNWLSALILNGWSAGGIDVDVMFELFSGDVILKLLKRKNRPNIAIFTLLTTPHGADNTFYPVDQLDPIELANTSPDGVYSYLLKLSNNIDFTPQFLGALCNLLNKSESTIKVDNFGRTEVNWGEAGSEISTALDNQVRRNFNCFCNVFKSIYNTAVDSPDSSVGYLLESWLQNKNFALDSDIEPVEWHHCFNKIFGEESIEPLLNVLKFQAGYRTKLAVIKTFLELEDQEPLFGWLLENPEKALASYKATLDESQRLAKMNSAHFNAYQKSNIDFLALLINRHTVDPLLPLAIEQAGDKPGGTMVTSWINALTELAQSDDSIAAEYFNSLLTCLEEIENQDHSKEYCQAIAQGLSVLLSDATDYKRSVQIISKLDDIFWMEKQVLELLNSILSLWRNEPDFEAEIQNITAINSDVEETLAEYRAVAAEPDTDEDDDVDEEDDDGLSDLAQRLGSTDQHSLESLVLSFSASEKWVQASIDTVAADYYSASTNNVLNLWFGHAAVLSKLLQSQPLLTNSMFMHLYGIISNKDAAMGGTLYVQSMQALLLFPKIAAGNSMRYAYMLQLKEHSKTADIATKHQIDMALNELSDSVWEMMNPA